LRVTFGAPIDDADEHELPARLLAFWAEHGDLSGASAGAGQRAPGRSASEVHREP
jgi:hypothetical protein